MNVSPVESLLTALKRNGEADAIVWRDLTTSHGALADRVAEAASILTANGVTDGAVVGLRADFSPTATALLLALMARRCVLVPLERRQSVEAGRLSEVAQTEIEVTVGAEEQVAVSRSGRTASHRHYSELRRRNHPGLVLFSSGTSGAPKGAVHDLVPLLDKFSMSRPAHRSIGFLLFDHIGGFNTLFHVLSNGGCVIVLEDRQPEAVCRAIERHGAQLLPTTPTFLNLLLLSGAADRHDLSSLQLVTYGTEPMPAATLARVRDRFPDTRLLQTYGLAEVGILRSQSREQGSLWMRVGGEGIETRVVDGMLEILTPSAMLGYLNAESPFTADGWFRTGDAVEVDGEWMRVLGRGKELINVGGAKVSPAEVEGVIEAMPEVRAATVFGQSNSVMGQIVCARVRLREGSEEEGFPARLRRHCRQRLERYKVPVRVEVSDEELHSDRYKKVRRAPAAQAESGSSR